MIIMDIDTSERPEVRPRGSGDIQDVIRELQEHVGEWIEYSDHATRGAARQRVHALRAGANFRDLPVEWATRRDEPGNIRSRVRVYCRWLPSNHKPGDSRRIPPLPL